jgi:hypothetical protein
VQNIYSEVKNGTGSLLTEASLESFVEPNGTNSYHNTSSVSDMPNSLNGHL